MTLGHPVTLSKGLHVTIGVMNDYRNHLEREDPPPIGYQGQSGTGKNTVLDELMHTE